MRLGLLLICAAIPFLEIALLIKVGQMIGFWLTFMLVVISALFGGFVIYEQGFQVMGRALEAMNRGKPPIAPVIDGMFILLGGILLIMPGFISDALGLALLVPALRHRFAVWSLRRLFRSGHMRMFVFGERAEQERARRNGQGTASGPRDGVRPASPQPPAGDGPIIEGEFQRLDERTMDRSRNPPPSGGR